VGAAEEPTDLRLLGSEDSTAHLVMSPRWRRDASENAIEFVERSVEVLIGSVEALRHPRMRAELAVVVSE